MAAFSISLGNSKAPSRRPSPPPPTNGKKRDHSALLDDDSDEESAPRKQNITHFDTRAGGAVDATRPKPKAKEALVIAPLANRDWKADAARKRAAKYGIPAPGQEGKDAGVDGEGAGGEKVEKEREGVLYGLNVPSRPAAMAEDGVDDGAAQEAPQESASAAEKTDEQRAIDALLGKVPESTLTIPAANEEEAFVRDYDSAPAAPTLSDYAAVPVEEFGAAMLRGMGWKGTNPSDPSTNTKPGSKQKSQIPARRPALLGIGADPNAAVAEELGAWGRQKGRGPRKDITYNPLVLKNAKTGERLTEEELKQKMQEQKEKEANERFMVNDIEVRDKEKEKRRRERDYDDKERRDRDRKKDRRYEDDDDRRDRHRSRRDRSSSYDRERERRHRRDKEDRDRDYDRRDRDHDRRDKEHRRREDSDRRRDRHNDDRRRDHRR